MKKTIIITLTVVFICCALGSFVFLVLKPSTQACVMVNFEPVENNVITLVHDRVIYGKIVYNPDTQLIQLIEYSYGVRTEESMFEGAHVLLGLPIENNLVIATEVTRCGSKLYYIQEVITLKEWNNFRKEEAPHQDS